MNNTKTTQDAPSAALMRPERWREHLRAVRRRREGFDFTILDGSSAEPVKIY